MGRQGSLGGAGARAGLHLGAGSLDGLDGESWDEVGKEALKELE